MTREDVIMVSNSWYRISKDVELKDETKVRIYRTVFETTDYETSEKSVDWCRQLMDKEGEHNDK